MTNTLTMKSISWVEVDGSGDSGLLQNHVLSFLVLKKSNPSCKYRVETILSLFDLCITNSEN